MHFLRVDQWIFFVLKCLVVRMYLICVRLPLTKTERDKDKLRELVFYSYIYILH